MAEKKTQSAMRFNGGKMRFNLIPKDALVELARVYSIGALKYEDGNWLKGMPWMDMVDCAERHFALWQMGHARDPDTKCHHLAQVAWNVLGLLVYELRGLGTDNRTKLPIDESFNWTDGPAKALGLSMSADEQAAIREKYAKARQEHQAKKESEGVAEPEVQSEVTDADLFFEPAPFSNTLVRAAIRGDLSSCDGPDGREHYVGDEAFQAGDFIVVHDGFMGPRITQYVRSPSGPFHEITPVMFERGDKADLIRDVRLFDPWHVDRVSIRLSGKPLPQLSYSDRTIVLRRYVQEAIKYAKEHAVPLDPAAVTKTLNLLLEQ